MAVAMIALGANMGACEVTLRQATALIVGERRRELVAVSPLLVTTPVDAPPGSPDFLNGVLAVRTDEEPLMLLESMMAVERQFGRDRAREVFHGPRTLDLDLLMYGDRVMNTERLTLPHPRMHTRRFVLEPLCAIAPHCVHPTLDKTMLALLKALGE